MKNQPKKGTYGYLDQLKKAEWSKAAIMLAVPVLIFLIGWLVSRTRMQVVTVIAIVGCLPGCNQVVHAIIASRYHSIDKELYEAVEQVRNDQVVLYENIFTTYDQNFSVDCLFISGRNVAGYSSDEKLDSAAAEAHLNTILRQNAYKQQVKILKDRSAYLEWIRDLASKEPEQVPFQGDDRCPGMTREEVIAYVLQAISL